MKTAKGEHTEVYSSIFFHSRNYLNISCDHGVSYGFLLDQPSSNSYGSARTKRFTSEDPCIRGTKRNTLPRAASGLIISRPLDTSWLGVAVTGNGVR